MALRDLLVQFGVKVDGFAQINRLNISIKNTVGAARQAGDAIDRWAKIFVGVKLIQKAKDFVENLLQQADALQHNAERLGLTTEELQQYGYAAQITGVPVEKLAVGLRYFNRAVGEADIGTKSAVNTMKLLGINIHDANGQVRPSSELLFDFADALKKIPNQARRTALEMRVMGRTGSALLPMFQNGSAELRRVFKDIDELGGGFDKAFVKQAHDTDVQMKRLKMGWRSVYVAIAKEVLPAFNKWLERSIRNVKVLIDLAKHTYGFRTALVALTTGAAMAGLVKLFGLFAKGKTSISDWFLALTKNAALVAFAALLAVAYLVLDELYTGLQGGDTIIGDFMDKMGGDGTALTFWANLREIVDKVEQALDGVGFNWQSVVTAMLDSIPAIVKWSGIFVAYVVNEIDRAITSFRQLAIFSKRFVGGYSKSDDAQLQQLHDDYAARKAEYQQAALLFDSITSGAHNAYAGGFSGPVPTGRQIAHQYDHADQSHGRTWAGPMQVTVNQTIHGAGHNPKATGDEVGRATKGAVKSALTGRRDAYSAVNAGRPQTGH